MHHDGVIFSERQPLLVQPKGPRVFAEAGEQRLRETLLLNTKHDDHVGSVEGRLHLVVDLHIESLREVSRHQRPWPGDANIAAELPKEATVTARHA